MRIWTNEIWSIQTQIPAFQKGFYPFEILTIRKRFESFECKLQPFEQNSKHSNVNLNLSNEIRRIRMQIWTIRRDSMHLNPNSNHLKRIRSIWMQILTIQKGFKVFEWKFQPVKRDSKHSNPNSNLSKGIRSIRIQIWTLWTRFERSKGIRSIWMQIWMLWIPFRMVRSWIRMPQISFEWLNVNSNHLKGIWSFRIQFWTIGKGSKHLNANSNRFKAFKFKF